MKELIVAIDLELNQPSRRVVPPSDTTSAVIFSCLRTVAPTAEACGTAGFDLRASPSALRAGSGAEQS